MYRRLWVAAEKGVVSLLCRRPEERPVPGLIHAQVPCNTLQPSNSFISPLALRRIVDCESIPTHHQSDRVGLFSSKSVGDHMHG